MVSILLHIHVHTRVSYGVFYYTYTYIPGFHMVYSTTHTRAYQGFIYGFDAISCSRGTKNRVFMKYVGGRGRSEEIYQSHI